MKPYLSIILCASLLLQGCSSLSEVSKDEGIEEIREGDGAINLVMTDSTSVKLERHQYLLVSDTGNFYFGSGRYLRAGRPTSRWFHGTFSPTKAEPETVDYGKVQFVWRPDDETAIRFSPGSYLRVTPESGTGLYVCGLDVPIPLERIARVEVEGTNVIATTALVLGITGLVVGLSVAATFSMGSGWGSWGGGYSSGHTPTITPGDGN